MTFPTSELPVLGGATASISFPVVSDSVYDVTIELIEFPWLEANKELESPVLGSETKELTY